MSEMVCDMEDVGLLLKLANEAGGAVDVSRIKRRPEGSASRNALALAEQQGYLSRTGRITPSGYRFLGEWLNGTR